MRQKFEPTAPTAATTDVEPTTSRIIEVATGFIQSKALFCAVEFGVFTELAKGPLEGAELRGRLKLHERSARDFLDALVALNLLERKGGIYANTPETDFFLDQAKPSYIGGLLEMFNVRLYSFFDNLGEALTTGKPQNEATHAENIFDSLYSPVRLKGFLRAMTHLSQLGAQAMAEKFPWTDYGSFADLGAAEGGTAVQVALHHSHLNGVGTDLPMVRPRFEEYVAKHGLSDRLRFHGGDFFVDPLPDADVHIMGHVLHDWDLQQKKQLIEKAYQALPVGGALIVIEALIDDDRRENLFGLLMSLNMLIETPGGFDFTGADCCEWMQAAGFSSTYIEHLAGYDSMVVGIKDLRQI